MNDAALDGIDDAAVPPANGAAVASLTSAQLARRQCIIDAVLQLAEDGGYDAVQLRDVARISGVSLRTIYKYFGSRDELLVASILQWRNAVATQSAATITGNDFVERVISLFRQNYEAVAKQPKLFETFARVQFKVGDGVVLWGRDTMDAVLDEELTQFDPDFAADFRMIIYKVIYADYVHSANGHMALDEMWTHTERTIRRLGECAH